ESFARTLARLGHTLSVVIAPALFVGVACGLLAELQRHTGPLLLDRLVGAAITFIQVVLGWGLVTVFAGIQHRERHGEVVQPLDTAALAPALWRVVPQLLPQLAAVVGLSIVGPFFLFVSAALANILSIAAGVALAWLGTRWAYATVIVGSGEASGTAAFERSAMHVDPVFWPTLGSLLVIGLATVVPIVVAAAVVAAVLGLALPDVFVFGFVFGVALVVAAATIVAATVESAWSQVERGGADADAGDGSVAHTGGPTAVAPVTPMPIVELD
ncbi:MAG: hypothetical protein H7287_10760, partial [Thermoleophilia bacterium]|nr:hypothetical protein [Thermoleophilia bacterium]